MLQTIKNLFRRSDFLVGIVRAVRAGFLDVKKIQWSAMRRRKIQNYLRAHQIRKLQLGASNSLMAGWLNTDVMPTNAKVIYLDATRPFPFDDKIFDYVVCEHMIEHVEYPAAILLLHECFRILKPGGKIRVSTPDLKIVAGLLSNKTTAAQNHYIDWIAKRDLPEVDYCQAVFVVNNVLRAWGHQFLYDPETLAATMVRCGFEELKCHKAGESDDENLRGIQLHGKAIACEEVNQFETFAVEGRTPQSQK